MPKLTHTVTVGDTPVDITVDYGRDGWTITEINIGGLGAYELFYQLPDADKRVAEKIQEAVDQAIIDDAADIEEQRRELRRELSAS